MQPSPKGSRRVLFDWGVSSYFGWGIQGLHLLLGWARRSDLLPASLQPVDARYIDLDPLERTLIEPALQRSAEMLANLQTVQGKEVTTEDIVLHSIHNGLSRLSVGRDVNLVGSASIAIAIFDQTDFEAEAVERLRAYPLVLTSSSWNKGFLAEAGLEHVAVLHEGVDPSHFHPAARRNLFGDRFVVFSGGKLEYRKGQDLVLRAFRRFARRHADALLLASWVSPWPEFARSLEGLPEVSGPVFTQSGHVDMAAWVEANEISAHQFCGLGAVPNGALARILREADVAVFPNRAEGGTNLVAMECMACGVPTILSTNTGHLDLIDGANVFALESQVAIRGNNHRGWGESDVEEIVVALERAYRDRHEARRRGQLAAAFMAARSWQHRADRLAEYISACAGLQR